MSDLSFNNIEVIEGLDKLTNLRDVTLFNNRISHVENMDDLVDLHVLSLGNNDLRELENVSDIFMWMKLSMHCSFNIKFTFGFSC